MHSIRQCSVKNDLICLFEMLFVFFAMKDVLLQQLLFKSKEILKIKP